MNLFVYKFQPCFFCLFLFCSVHANHCQDTSFFISLVQLPANKSLFSSEYASSHDAEVRAIYSSYGSMLSLSCLQTVWPDLVLIVSLSGFFLLIPVVEGPPVTVVWGMWPSLLSYLGLTMSLCFMGGSLLFLYQSWGLISHHAGGVFPPLSPFFSCAWIFSCMAPDPWMALHLLPGWSLCFSWKCFPVLRSTHCLSDLVVNVLLHWYICSTCVLYFMWLTSPSLSPIMGKNALCWHPHWALLWLVHQQPSILLLDNYYRPCGKDKCIFGIIVLIIFSLTGL